MHTLKIATSLIFACSVALPAFAVEVKESSTIPPEAQAAVDQAVQDMPITESGAYDYSRIKLTKKEYLEQLGKSFDAMDGNGDGIVEGTELMSGQKGLSGKAGYGSDITDAAARDKGAQSNSAASSAGGIAPLNSRELIRQ